MHPPDWKDSFEPQVSAKDATNVDVAFRQVAVAAFQHFKAIKAQQEQEYDRTTIRISPCQFCCPLLDWLLRLLICRASD